MQWCGNGEWASDKTVVMATIIAQKYIVYSQ